jgi:hypothetical protein
MIRTWFALGVVVLLTGAAVAQEAKPPAAVKPIPPAANADFEYLIEMRVLEGKDLLCDDAAWRDSTVDRLQKLVKRPWEKATVVGAAPQPAPTPEATSAAPGPMPAPPAVAAYQRELAQSSTDDELWVCASMDVPGITTVAAPKLVTRTGQPVTLSIQTSSRFSYLEPLGDDKYQAKYSPVQELGMKVVVALQPVAGDDTSVDVSPLEIEVTALDGREPVEGLDLEVGKPIISTRSLKTTAKMKLGATRLIAIPSGPKTQAALLVRVKRASVRFDPQPPGQLDNPQNNK